MKEQLWLNLIRSLVEGKGVHTFPKRISSKLKTVVPLKIELAYCNVAIQHVGHYDTGTLQKIFLYLWHVHLFQVI